MYFSRIRLKSNILAVDYANSVSKNSYKEHQMLWELFPKHPELNRDFIYRYEPENHRPAYYIVSKRKPIDQENLWHIQTKNYSPILSIGQNFSFIIRVNPVITQKGKRHDIVIHEKKNIGYKEMDKHSRPSQYEIIAKTGARWLKSRAENAGFQIQNTALRIDRYQPRIIAQKSKARIIYSTMDFSGILEIDDVNKFQKTLMTGMGKAKAFGCGLMLIRRV